MLNCPYCKEEECVDVVIQTYTETFAESFNEDGQLGFELRDSRGELLGIDGLYQDIKFECCECFRNFKFTKNCKTEAYDETVTFDEEQTQAFLNGDSSSFIEIK